MLSSLYIQNFALLKEVKLEFQQGYTVITGETGSGKSILLNALNLVLGERADYKVIGPHSDKSVAEATFQIDAPRFKSFFESHDLDLFDETIVRREITSQGRSRAFINDIPVQLSVLKEFTEQLISIHSQYNTLDLRKKDFQLETLDILAGLTKEKYTYSVNYKEFKDSKLELTKLKSELEEALKDKDYTDFQLNELEELNLHKVDYSALEQQFMTIENADEIKMIYSQIQSEIGGEGAVNDRLGSLKNAISKAVQLDERFADYAQRINSVMLELSDIESNSEDVLAEMDLNAVDKIELENTLDSYNRALTKHRFTTQNELVELYDSLSLSLSNSDDLQFKIEALEKKVNQLEEIATKSSIQLHENRLKACAKIEKDMKSLLSDLKLPETELQFKLDKTAQLSVSGCTQIELLFSANKGMPLVPIENAASGGELSRVMLALQKMISLKRKMPTIFFDEIDTGVSGDVAQKIGNLLASMGENMQLFAISHLPQVAAKASNHFKVEKSNDGKLTQTSIRTLTHEQRIEEIARLMSGESINDAAISNAKALMN